MLRLMLTSEVADVPLSVDPDGPSLPQRPPMGWGRFI
jgi:hypothetical protein